MSYTMERDEGKTVVLPRLGLVVKVCEPGNSLPFNPDPFPYPSISYKLWDVQLGRFRIYFFKYVDGVVMSDIIVNSTPKHIISALLKAYQMIDSILRYRNKQLQILVEDNDPSNIIISGDEAYHIDMLTAEWYCIEPSYVCLLLMKCRPYLTPYDFFVAIKKLKTQQYLIIDPDWFDEALYQPEIIVPETTQSVHYKQWLSNKNKYNKKEYL